MDFENNQELNNLITQWVETGNVKLIKKIKKLSNSKYAYKLCKYHYTRTHDRFFIRSMKKLGLLYRIKLKFFLKRDKKRLAELEVQRNNKINEINNIISSLVNDDKFVYIMQYSFFDKKGENYFSGGGERYACDLAELISRIGYKVILIQCADENLDKPWHKKFNNIDVVGVNACDEDYFKIINSLTKPKLAIYSGAIPWNKDSYKPSILISHGITWDHPGANANIFWLENILHVADTIVSVDTNTISWFRSTFSKTIASNNIELNYIPNYVDLGKYSKADKDSVDKPLKIIFPRRCSAERGFWLFVDLIPELFTKFQNIEIDLVGFAHTKEIEQRIEYLSSQYPQRFKHYLCTAQQMPEVYRAADISLIPTLYSEGTSLSCIEAMASGNAVIATNIGGLPNLIINDYNGILINPDKKSLMQAITKLVLDKQYREQIRTNALNVAKVFSKVNWDKSWRDILSKYINISNNTKDALDKELAINNFSSNFLINKNKKSRLFITTGFVSLINSMAIVEQLDNINYDNHLIIYTSRTSKDFKNFNKNIVLNDYFKTIVFADDISLDENIKNIENKEFLDSFDEIYSTVQSSYNIWDKHNNINLIEEGISSYFSFGEIDYNNIKKIYLSNYFNQIHYQDSTMNDKVYALNKDLVKNVIEKIKIKNNLNFKYLQKDNLVLLLSQYIFQDFLADEEVVEFYRKHIDKLIMNNNSVLFKSHPRVNDTITTKLAQIYKDNPRFDFIPTDIKYPVELMIEDLNLKAIATSMSGGAINCSHLYDINCYGFGAKLIKEKHIFNNVRQYADIFLEYIPHIDKLYIKKEDKIC